MKLLCPHFHTSPRGLFVWQLLPPLDVVSYYLVASSVLPLVHFRARKRKTNLRSPLTSDRNLEESQNKNVLSSNDKTNNQWSRHIGLQEHRENQCHKKIASEGWRGWFLPQKLILRHTCEKDDCALPGNVMSGTKKYALLRKKEEIDLW